ncbi:MAG: lipase family protein [Acidobacteriota bacterium]
MNFDNSWDALLKPGKATVYFDKLNQTKFEVDATSYSKVNAWWLAELCRLIYRQGADEVKNGSGATRKEVLAAVNLDEVAFFDEGNTEAGLVKTTSSSGVQFAALILRGTNDLMDWLTDFNAIPQDWSRGGLVHKGFAKALQLVWDKVNTSIEHNVPSDCPLFITGHSLGAALATLAASLRQPRALYTFGSPRVGDKDFAKTLAGVKVFRVVNNRDVVTTVPPPLPFHHLGESHYITHDGGMLTNPDDDTVARDRLKRDRLPFFSGDWHKLFTDAPEPLADHAPVNYVAHLERQV